MIATSQSAGCEFCLGSKTEVAALERHVRSALHNRHHQAAPLCPLRATTGLMHRSKRLLYSITSSARPETAAGELGGLRSRFQGNAATAFPNESRSLLAGPSVGNMLSYNARASSIRRARSSSRFETNRTTSPMCSPIGRKCSPTVGFSRWKTCPHRDVFICRSLLSGFRIGSRTRRLIAFFCTS
jgi:hypothetical protein